MSNKEETRPKYKDTHGGEIIGSIIFTIVIILLMWAASVWFR